MEQPPVTLAACAAGEAEQLPEGGPGVRGRLRLGCVLSGGQVGFGRIVAVYHLVFTLYQVH